MGGLKIMRRLHLIEYPIEAVMQKILLAFLFLFSTQILADASITVSKGDANLCEVMPAQARKANGGYAHHYNKAVNPRQVSSDLWESAKNGLDFFHLSKSQRQSQTVQLSFVDKYSTFWYFIKLGGQVKGPYFYDFVLPESESRTTFVDIELELPCSCFINTDKPPRCSSSTSSRSHYFRDEHGRLWQQINENTAIKAE